MNDRAHSIVYALLEAEDVDTFGDGYFNTWQFEITQDGGSSQQAWYWRPIDPNLRICKWVSSRSYAVRFRDFLQWLSDEHPEVPIDQNISMSGKLGFQFKEYQARNRPET